MIAFWETLLGHRNWLSAMLSYGREWSGPIIQSLPPFRCSLFWTYLWPTIKAINECIICTQLFYGLWAHWTHKEFTGWDAGGNNWEHYACGKVVDIWSQWSVFYSKGSSSATNKNKHIWNDFGNKQNHFGGRRMADEIGGHQSNIIKSSLTTNGSVRRSLNCINCPPDMESFTETQLCEIIMSFALFWRFSNFLCRFYGNFPTPDSTPRCLSKFKFGQNNNTNQKRLIKITNRSKSIKLPSNWNNFENSRF